MSLMMNAIVNSTLFGFQDASSKPDDEDDNDFHLLEESEYRDYEDFICEYDSSDSEASDQSDAESIKEDRSVPIYPGSITTDESILSIMKYSIRHKTTYSALTIFLG
jgi:hypothetical protein